MSQHVQHGHYVGDTQHFADNMPPAPASLREAFAIPMNTDTLSVTSHISSSATHILLEEEKGDN